MSVDADPTRLMSYEAAGTGNSTDAAGLGEVDRARIMDRIYERGDRLVTRFILLHALIALGLACFYQTWLVTGVVTACAVAMFTLSVTLLPRAFVTRCLAGVALQVFVVLHIYQMHGLSEMHFFFFTAFTVLIVYQDWKCMWPGALGLIAQHTGFALLHNAGSAAGAYFYEPGYVGFTKLALHFAIALSQVGICGYWAYLLREQTLASAVQHRNLRGTEEAMRLAKEEAERANDAKSEFLSRMSHELRTPLNAILGFGQLLEHGGLEKKPLECVGHILRGGRHLLGLIDEVLAISRIEAGHLTLSLEPVAVAGAVKDCLNLVSRQAAERKLELVNRCADAGTAALYVQADHQRLHQVLLNFLSNAVKYNRAGGSITVSCRETALPGPDGTRRLRVEVTDTGHGLAPGEIGRLFMPFDRLGAEHTATEGTGLGLALSKGLMETMGGAIGVDSVPGRGSTFWLELPTVDAPFDLGGLRTAVLDLSDLGARHHGMVLYIEDNLSNLRLIEMLLGDRPGLDLVSAQQGLLGLELARSRRPDLVLLDLHLPDLPGWEVLARLQADALTRDIPVVVVSADATPKQVERLRAAGARDYLTKPIDVARLIETLDTHVPARELAA